MQGVVATTQSIPVPEPMGVRRIEVIPVMNGFTVNVGCQTVVFKKEEADLMGQEIARYIRNPESVEKEYFANANPNAQGRY